MLKTADNPDIKYQPKVQGYSYSNATPVPPSNNPQPQTPIVPISGNPNVNPPQPPKHKSNIFLTLLLEIFALLFLFFAFLAVLNYFNIISLKNISPQFFGSLPNMSSKTQEQTSLNTSGSSLTKPINKTSINDIPLAEITTKIGRFIQYPIPSGTGYILSSQYPTIVAIEKDTKNNLVWVAASFDGKQLTSSTSAIITGDINSTYEQFEGLTIWYAIDKNTKIYKKTPEGSKPDFNNFKTGIDYAENNIALGSTIFQIISQINQGTNDKPELNKETLNLIKNSANKENVRSDKTFIMYAEQVFP